MKLLYRTFMFLFIVSFLGACGSQQTTEETNSTERANEQPTSASGLANPDHASSNLQDGVDKSGQQVVEASYEDFLHIQEDIVLVFKTKEGEEIIFHRQIDDPDLGIKLHDEMLQANPKLVGKSFKITYKKAKHINAKGEEEMVNKPVAMEVLDKSP